MREAVAYRRLNEAERRRDLAAFLRWLLEKNKGRVIEVSVRRYNKWPMGYGPLTAGDSPVFHRLVLKIAAEAGVKPRFVRSNSSHYAGKRYYFAREDVERMLAIL